MERNYTAEIDQIKQELAEIKALLQHGATSCKTTASHQQHAKTSMEDTPYTIPLPDGPHMTPAELDAHIAKRIADIVPADVSAPELSHLLVQLVTDTLQRNTSGAVGYYGTYTNGGRQSIWVQQASNETLLALVENGAAAKVLACIGNNDRLTLLLTLLRTPMSVAQLVAHGYSSTGQVYHLLKPLQAADLVVEDTHTRGMYVVQPHRVQGIIMLLAGIQDMLDTKYTQGAWETE